jgi:hypothetical protein
MSIRQQCIQTFVTGMWCEVCVLSPDLKTIFSAALSYPDIRVSKLMHISSLNVMFCVDVSYVYHCPKAFLLQTIALTLFSIFHTRIVSCSVPL